MEGISTTPTNSKTLNVYITVVFLAVCITPFTNQLDFIAGWQDPSAHKTVMFFQFFSDSISFISFGVPLIFTLVKVSKSNANKKQVLLSFLYVVLSIAVAGLVSRIIKETVAEPRPYEVDSRIMQLSVGGGYSMPSGHTTEAFASAMAMALLIPEWFVILPLFSWAMLVGASRIYLGVHYPFDISVGMLIGSSSSILFFKFLYKKYKWDSLR
ncbi:MAG: phosphatase PAP2 family protein [Bacteroidetes bacterium]|nr:phosphatase PAP2 family protein [Bacteroidota bacterium]MBS1541139.1 phosphatase PAP2 family protein [Bacteroidota bacterium]